ncbi:MAG: hypothetical protein FJ087_01605 [Deltaproteobacteria bacterium]|nr:hypothetical protein [Deltaproteobacteria bacterium]
MALSRERNTAQRSGDLLAFPVAASVKVFAGGLVVLDAGYAKPGAAGTGLVAVGRAEETVDNSAGLAGAEVVAVRPGTFKWANSADADLIAQANVGGTCYVVDDQAVAKTDGTGTRSAAGKVVAVDADGVWVKTGL